MRTSFKVLLVFSAIGFLNLPGGYAQNSFNPDKINLLVSNICEYYGQYVVGNGPDSSGMSATLGSAGCALTSSYIHYDSLSILEPVEWFKVDHNPANYPQPKLLLMADENRIITFHASYPIYNCIPVVSANDTLLIDSIAGIDMGTQQFAVIRNTTTDNLIIYNAPAYDSLLIQSLNMVPLLVSLNFADVAIVGIDSNNDLKLNVIEVSSGLMTEYGVFDSLARNPISMLLANSKVYLISQPGDSAIYMSTYNFTGNSITTQPIYSGSGAHAFDWQTTNFHFQPETDLSGNNLETKILIHDATNVQPLGIFDVNRRMHKIIFAGDDLYSYYPFMHGVEETGINNQVYIYEIPYYNLLDSFVTDSQVDFVESDFRCGVGIEEYDDSLVKLLAYPNPAGNSITISASGLICGRDYKMDIIDMNGKVWFEKTIHAKMSLEIPLEHMAKGVYILRIHTLKGMVTEKIVKE